MSEETAAEAARRKEKERQGKSAAAIDALDASEQGGGEAKPVVKPKAKPKEKAGVGKDNTRANLETRIAATRSKITVARNANNSAFADKLAPRLAAMQAELAALKK